MRNRLSMIALAMLTFGCSDREPVASTVVAAQPAPVVQERSAFLSVSNMVPDSGSTIIVTGNVSSDAAPSIASYVVRLGFDPKALHFVRDIPLKGMMRVVNPRDSDVVVAAASGSGVFDGKLFSVEFRVEDPAGLSSLRLTLNEMNDRDFASQLRTITPSTALSLEQKASTARATPH